MNSMNTLLQALLLSSMPVYLEQISLSKYYSKFQKAMSLSTMQLLSLLPKATAQHLLAQEHKNLKSHWEGNIRSKDVGLGNPSSHDVSVQSQKIVSPSLCCRCSSVNEDWEPVEKLADGLGPTEQMRSRSMFGEGACRCDVCVN